MLKQQWVRVVAIVAMCVGWFATPLAQDAANAVANPFPVNVSSPDSAAVLRIDPARSILRLVDTACDNRQVFVRYVPGNVSNPHTWRRVDNHRGCNSSSRVGAVEWQVFTNAETTLTLQVCHISESGSSRCTSWKHVSGFPRLSAPKSDVSFSFGDAHLGWGASSRVLRISDADPGDGDDVYLRYNLGSSTASSVATSFTISDGVTSGAFRLNYIKTPFTTITVKLCRGVAGADPCSGWHHYGVNHLANVVAIAKDIAGGHEEPNWSGGKIPYSWGGGHGVNPPRPSLGTCFRYSGSIHPCPASHTVGLDCSGFVRWVYALAWGRDILGDRGTTSQITKFTRTSHPLPGDVLFYGSPVHHVAIYLGSGKMAEAHQTGEPVRVTTVRSHALGYYHIAT